MPRIAAGRGPKQPHGAWQDGSRSAKSPVSPANGCESPDPGVSAGRPVRPLPLATFFALLACSRPDPPGAERAQETKLVGSPSVSGSAAAREAPKLGTAADALPFSPTGRRLVSIAWRTWVYTDTEARRERYGYLRAGS